MSSISWDPRYPSEAKPRRAHPVTGFTLLEILVALVVAGLLTAMIASVLGRGVVASSALEETSEGQRSRIVLHRLLSMDLRNILPETELTITEQGFSLETSRNHLLPGPLPMTVTWIFSGKEVRRTEELKELDYTQSLALITELDGWTLELYDLGEKRWVNLPTWLHPGERPAPAGMRLELRFHQRDQWDFIHRLPLQDDVPH